MTTPLSPSALAVMDAVVKVYPAFPDEVAAAAIQAVAMAVLEEHLSGSGPLRNLDGGMHQFASRLLTIADELEVKYD